MDMCVKKRLQCFKFHFSSFLLFQDLRETIARGRSPSAETVQTWIRVTMSLWCSGLHLAVVLCQCSIQCLHILTRLMTCLNWVHMTNHRISYMTSVLWRCFEQLSFFWSRYVINSKWYNEITKSCQVFPCKFPHIHPFFPTVPSTPTAVMLDYCHSPLILPTSSISQGHSVSKTTFLNYLHAYHILSSKTRSTPQWLLSAK